MPHECVAELLTYSNLGQSGSTTQSAGFVYCIEGCVLKLRILRK